VNAVVTDPEKPRWKPHTIEFDSVAPPEATRRPAGPEPNRVRWAAVSAPDSTSSPAPETATLWICTRPAVTTDPSTEDERIVDPSRSRTRPCTCSAPASPRTASAMPDGSRSDIAKIEERSSPRSTRPSSAVTRRPLPITRTGSPVASVTLVLSVRRPTRMVSSPGAPAAACSAAARLGCWTHPASWRSTQNVAPCASAAGTSATASNSAIRLTTREP
jgi:hypothetical protein